MRPWQRELFCRSYSTWLRCEGLLRRLASVSERHVMVPQCGRAVDCAVERFSWFYWSGRHPSAATTSLTPEHGADPRRKLPVLPAWSEEITANVSTLRCRLQRRAPGFPLGGAAESVRLSRESHRSVLARVRGQQLGETPSSTLSSKSLCALVAL